MSHFEGPITYRVGNDGLNVLIRAESGVDVICTGGMPVAQAREFALAVLEQCDRVEGREGILGEAHRNAIIRLPVAEYTLSSSSGSA